MDNAEAARNYVQDNAVVFLQIQSANFIQLRYGLVFLISVYYFPSRSLLVHRPS